MFFVLFDSPHNPNVIEQARARDQVDSSERAWTKRRKPKRSDSWRSACYCLRIGAVRRLLLQLFLMSEGRARRILLIRALKWTAQEAIPSERGSLKLWWMSFSDCLFLLLMSISQVIVVVIVFFGALLRHATKSSVPSFLLTFFLTQPS